MQEGLNMRVAALRTWLVAAIRGAVGSWRCSRVLRSGLPEEAGDGPLARCGCGSRRLFALFGGHCGPCRSFSSLFSFLSVLFPKLSLPANLNRLKFNR